MFQGFLVKENNLDKGNLQMYIKENNNICTNVENMFILLSHFYTFNIISFIFPLYFQLE